MGSGLELRSELKLGLGLRWVLGFDLGLGWKCVGLRMGTECGLVRRLVRSGQCWVVVGDGVGDGRWGWGLV